MRCRFIRHFFWVLTVCQCGRLGVSRKQRVKSGSVPFLMISLDQNIEGPLTVVLGITVYRCLKF